MQKVTIVQALSRAVDVLKMVAADPSGYGLRVGSEAPFWWENGGSDLEAAEILRSLAEQYRRR